ncbi:MAG: aminotransferase class I/II-fold pyridoxal phosphate-dependent enzyme [Dehalococcoidia bacterium]|jgi:aminotransferase
MVKRDPISKKVRALSPSGIRKYFDIIAGMDDVISLGVGEPDFVTPWHICEAGIWALEKGDTAYTSNYGLIELREEIARYIENRYGLTYDPKTEILITVGVSEGLDLAIRAITDPGDEIIIPEPTYVSYKACTLLAGGVDVPIPSSADKNFEMRAVEIEKRITRKTKAILLGYPNNPTGAIMERDELSKIAKLATKNDLTVISDEVYERLTYGVEHASIVPLPGMRDRSMLLGGFSKSYAMTGWRIGWAAANADMIESMMKIHQYTMLCASVIAQRAALEALRNGEPQVQEMLADYDKRRRVIVKGLNRIGLACFEPRGAFYAFPSIKKTGMSSDEFAEKLLREQKVIVIPGSAFGKCGEGHVRCCYATSMDEIEEALERIESFVKKHRP